MGKYISLKVPPPYDGYTSKVQRFSVSLPSARRCNLREHLRSYEYIGADDISITRYYLRVWSVTTFQDVSDVSARLDFLERFAKLPAHTLKARDLLLSDVRVMRAQLAQKVTQIMTENKSKIEKL